MPADLLALQTFLSHLIQIRFTNEWAPSGTWPYHHVTAVGAHANAAISCLFHMEAWLSAHLWLHVSRAGRLVSLAGNAARE